MFDIKNQNWYKHLCTINEHKLEVGKNCFRCGLYRQGILHDLSKYSPAEFFVGAKYFQGNRSPNDAEREDKGYTASWLHHKGRNKHHLEYWMDYDLEKRDGSFTGMKMPDNYIVEMFCDRVAASKIYNKEKYTDRTALDYFRRGKGKGAMHPYVRKKINLLLTMLAEKGEDYTFAYARRYMQEYKKYLKRQKYKVRLQKKNDKASRIINEKMAQGLDKKYMKRVRRDKRSSRVFSGVEKRFRNLFKI